MTIDWISIIMAVVGALATHLISKSSQPAATPAQPAATPAPQPAQTSTGLFHGRLLNRLMGGSAGGSATQNASPTGHPILDSVVSMLESVVAQNPQLLTSLSGVLVSLQHPQGSVNLNLSNATQNSGGTISVIQTPASAGPAVPAAAH